MTSAPFFSTKHPKRAKKKNLKKLFVGWELIRKMTSSCMILMHFFSHVSSLCVNFVLHWMSLKFFGTKKKEGTHASWSHARSERYMFHRDE